MTDQPMPRAQSSSNPFDAGIFKALVDFSFVSFATPKLIRILYLLSFVGIALGAVVYFVIGLASGSALLILLSLVVVPIVTILMLVYVRVIVELLAILFKIGDNTSRMVAALEAGQTGGITPTHPEAVPAWSAAPPPDPGAAGNP